MDTIRMENKGNTQMIAHRGLSGLETENTNAAFVAAGNRSHVGIETDVHKTIDGHFVIIHDDETGRVAEKNMVVEQSRFDDLRALVLKQKDGKVSRSDLRIPTMEEYIGICKAYGKTAVLELKNRFTKEDIAEICRRIKKAEYLDNVIFISFVFENLEDLKALYPDQPAQFLTVERKDLDWLTDLLSQKHIDIDIQFGAVTEERVASWHAKGLKVNCWTVDHPDDAKRMIDAGVDFITSNILE